MPIPAFAIIAVVGVASFVVANMRATSVSDDIINTVKTRKQTEPHGSYTKMVKGEVYSMLNVSKLRDRAKAIGVAIDVQTTRVWEDDVDVKVASITATW